MFRRISSFLASEVNVDGRKLGNFYVRTALCSHFQHKRKRQFAERNDREDREGDEAARIVHSSA